MIKVVIDTDILIDSAHGFAPWVREITHKPDRFLLIIPTIVIAEYLTAHENNDKKHYERTKEFLHLFKIQELTFEIAEILGTLLRNKTYTRNASTADLIIASTSIYFDAQLSTRNTKDFAKIPGLHFFDSKSLNK